MSAELSHNKPNMSLHLVRTLACMAVIVIHTCRQFLTGYSPGTSQFLWASLFASTARLAVPLFVMTSGALMLDEEKTFSCRKLFTKNILPLFLLLIFWSGLYAVGYGAILPIAGGRGFSLKFLLSSFLRGHYHLWYLYMQIGLYLTLPFLRQFVRKKNQKLILLYIGLSLILQFTLPLLRAAAKNDFIGEIYYLIKQFSLGFFNEYVTYYLAGWYLVHIGVADRRKRTVIYILSAFALAGNILYINMTSDTNTAYSNSNLLLFLYAFGIFLALSRVKFNPRIEPGLLLLSKRSFGIYVLHAFVLDAVVKIIPSALVTPLYISAVFAVVFAVSLLITYGLSKIPILKRLVRM